MAADGSVAFPLGLILDNRCPGCNRRHRLSCLAPQSDQARTDQRIFQPLGRIDIPAVTCAARTTAWFVVRQLRPRAGIVGLLRFPGDDPALDVNLPRTAAGAVHPVGRTHNLVMLPTFAIAILPIARFAIGDAVTVGECLAVAVEKGQSVEKLAHGLNPFKR